MSASAAGKDLFDRSDQYAEMLERGIRLSGEDQQFFIAGRIRELERRLPAGWEPRRILDFGCGIGHTTVRLAEAFPNAKVIGVDTSAQALAHAEASHSSMRVSFRRASALSQVGPFDLCYTNGVFHHIPPGERIAALRLIHDALSPGGRLALFENNPWNPGTRLVMSRIPFDRDAEPLSALAARRLLCEAGFGECEAARFLFYFPRPLAWLRFTETWLARLPLGAQYLLLAVRLEQACQ